MSQWCAKHAFAILSLYVPGAAEFCQDTELGSRSGQIISPNFPWMYPNSANCTLRYRTPVDTRTFLTIQVNEFNLERCCDALIVDDSSDGTARFSEMVLGQTYTCKYICTCLFLTQMIEHLKLNEEKEGLRRR